MEGLVCGKQKNKHAHAYSCQISFIGSLGLGLVYEFNTDMLVLDYVLLYT